MKRDADINKTEDNTSLYVSIGLLEGALAIAIAVMAWYTVSKKHISKPKAVAAKPTAISAICTTSAVSTTAA